jgi:hypothetical protein
VDVSVDGDGDGDGDEAVIEASVFESTPTTLVC